MRFTTSITAPLMVVTSVLAQSNQPQCVATCISQNPTSSVCNGDEQGQALADCECQSLSGSPLLQCIMGCSTDDQTAYAKTLDGDCGQRLFPDLNVPDNNGGSSNGGGGSSNGGGDGSSNDGSNSGSAGDAGDAATDLKIPSALAAGVTFAVLMAL